MRVNISMTSEFQTKLREKSKEAGMKQSEYIRFVLMRFWEGK